MSSWETRDSDFCLICLPSSAATYFWKCCYIHLFIIFQFDWYLFYSQNVFYAFIDCCWCWKWRVPDTWWIRKQIFAREIWTSYHPGAMPINKTCHHSFISAKHHCKRKYISTKHKNIGQFCPEYQVPRKVMILNIPNLWSNCYILWLPNVHLCISPVTTHFNRKQQPSTYYHGSMLIYLMIYQWWTQIHVYNSQLFFWLFVSTEFR